MRSRTSTDPVTTAVGDFGLWQMKVAGLASVAAVFTAWSTLSIAFLAPTVDHWCAKPPQFANLSDLEWKEMAIPRSTSDVRMYISIRRSFTRRSLMNCVKILG
jgi:hypothetical protein